MRAAAAGALVGGVLGGSALASPPNLLVIVMDDVGVDKVGVYAGDYAPGGRYDAYADSLGSYEPAYLPATPTLDELAAVGVRFGAAWSNPSCSPTRATLTTGLYGHDTQVGVPYPMGQELDADWFRDESLPTRLDEEHGYATALYGKWHLGETGTNGRTEWGYDGVGLYNRILGDWAHPVSMGYDDFDGAMLGEVYRYDDWDRVRSGRTLKCRRGRVTVPCSYVIPEIEYAPTRNVEDTVAFAEGHLGEPWYVVVALNAAHRDDDGDGAWDSDEVSPDCASWRDRYEGDIDAYRATVECLDEHLRLLVEGLWALDGGATLDHTFVVLLGDNGTPGEVMEGLFDRVGHHKGQVLEGGVRVPFLFGDGGDWAEALGLPSPAEVELVGNPGLVVTDPVQVLDSYATLLDLAGERGAPTDSLQSRSLLTCLAPDADDRCAPGTRADPRVLYTELFLCDGFPCQSEGVDHTLAGSAAIWRGDWKFVASWNGTALDEQFFFKPTDPLDRTELSPPTDVESELRCAWAELVAAPSPGTVPWGPETRWNAGRVSCP